MGKRGVILVLAVLLLALAVQAAQPPAQINVDTIGLTVVFPKKACYISQPNLQFAFDVVNSTNFKVDNTTTICQYVIINGSAEHQQAGTALYHDVDKHYYITLNESSTQQNNIYEYYLYCNNSQEAGFVSDTFQTTLTGDCMSEDMAPIALTFLIPILLAVLVIAGVATLGESHSILKMFLYMFSFVPFFSTIQVAMTILVKYYHVPTLEAALGFMSEYTGWFYFVLITYFIIAFIIWAIEFVAKKRLEKLEY